MTVCVCVWVKGVLLVAEPGVGGVCRDHSESRSVFLHGCVFYVETVVRACVWGHIHGCMSASSGPGTTRAFAFPDCAVAAVVVVVVALGQLFVGARGGGSSFGLGGGAPAGVEGGAGTRPAQGRLQGAGRSKACWEKGMNRCTVTLSVSEFNNTL